MELTQGSDPLVAASGSASRGQIGFAGRLRGDRQHGFITAVVAVCMAIALNAEFRVGATV